MSNKLVGVVSIYELMSKDLRSRLDAVMIRNLILCHPNDHIKETLKKMYRYNLSALPVVSHTEKKLLGIVTFRDAISLYLPKKWKLRIRQVFANGF